MNTQCDSKPVSSKKKLEKAFAKNIFLSLVFIITFEFLVRKYSKDCRTISTMAFEGLREATPGGTSNCVKNFFFVNLELKFEVRPAI